MSLILSIETATKVCSVALHENGKLLTHQHLHIDKSHSGLLTVLIENALFYAGSKMKDVTAVAVSSGPGSYTGLRIGTSTAKGLCYALDIPLIGINTLEAMAQGMQAYLDDDSLACPMIDARRMEVYCLITDKGGKQLEQTQAKIVNEDSFQDYLESNRVYFFGDGSSKCIPLLGNNKNAKFVDGIVPSAVSIGELAEKKLVRQEYEDVVYFEPFYLKEFQSNRPGPKS